jgi:hypothetical protein
MKIHCGKDTGNTITVFQMSLYTESIIREPAATPYFVAMFE